MHDENKNINKPDSFSESIRLKLENHELPVDASLWGEIESRVAGRKNKIIPFWLWISGGAAVATLALLLSLPFFNQQDKTYVDNIAPKTVTQGNVRPAISEGQQQSQKVGMLETQADANHWSENAVSQPITTKKQQQTGTTSEREAVLEDFVAKNEVTLGNREVNNVNETLNDSKDSLLARSTENPADTQTPKSKKRYIPDTLIEEPENEAVVKKDTRGGWALAASMGMGNNTSFSSMDNLMYADYPNKSLTEATANYTRIMTSNDFSNQNYRTPVSFGLMLRKNLSSNVGIESGLMYTYLSTSFEQPGTFVSYDAELMLHYLGVPLNLVVKLWSNPNWEIYLSGGIMGEKGLRSIYVQNQHIGGNQTITTTAKTNIDGLQWSLNGAVGTTYKLNRNVGIYFEPKFGYFFENGQPVSARTGNPFVVGVTGGLRFQF